MWVWILVGIMAVVIVLLLLKIYALQSAAKEMESTFADRLSTGTNTLIDISSTDRYMRRLANSLNLQLRKLREERHRFEQGNRELQNAVTNISHDLRTPLTAICSYLDLLEAEERTGRKEEEEAGRAEGNSSKAEVRVKGAEKWNWNNGEKSSKAEEYLRIIRDRAELLIQLTDELFQYSMILSAENNKSVEPINVGALLEESIASFYTALIERKIEPVVHIPEDRVVRTLNRSALLRVFSNLLNNAIKYSDGDLEITLSETGTIVFSNTASGLNQVQVGKLFDRFYTVEAARKSTGLGLSIARTLMEQMDGTIAARYENNRLYMIIGLPK